jgi:hypothetical protein
VISQPWPWARIFVSRHQLTNARSFKLTLIGKLWRIVCVIGQPSENCVCLDAKIVVSLRNATLVFQTGDITADAANKVTAEEG